MKNRKIVGLFLFVFLLIGMYAVGYIYGQSLCKDDFNYKEETRIENPVVDVDNEYNAVLNQDDIIVKSSTKLFIEEYNIEDKTILLRESEVPIALLGLNRNEVINVLPTMNQYFDVDKDKEVVGLMLMDFNAKQMVIRKNVADIEEETTTENIEEYKYYMVLSEDKIFVYDKTNDKVFIETSINIDTLDKDSKEKLTKGILVRNISELYRMLESFTS